MKSVKTNEEKKINWAVAGKVSHDEFLAAIKKAEEGSFYTIDEAKERLAEWKQKRGL